MTDDTHSGDGDGGDDREVRPVGSVDGIGESESIRLAEAGVATVDQLREADPVELADRTGFREAILRQWMHAAGGADAGASPGETPSGEATPGESAREESAPGESAPGDSGPGGSGDSGPGGEDSAREAARGRDHGTGDDPDGETTILYPDRESSGDPDTAGSTPEDASGSSATPEEPTGSHSAPEEPTGSPSTPQDSTGSPSTPEDPTGSHSAPETGSDVRSASEVTGSGSGADRGSRPGAGGEVEPERGAGADTGGRGGEAEPDRAAGGPGGSRGAGGSGGGDPRPGGSGGSGPSEEDLEREILPPEERVGPGETLCEGCGEVVDDDAVVCPQCGIRQDRGEANDEAAGSGTWESSGRGTPESGDQGTPKGQQQVDAQLAGLASLFVPGAGAFMAGQNTRAAAWLGLFLGVLLVDLVVFVISLALIGVVVGILGFFLIPIFHLIVHPIAAYDAYNQGKKINAGEVRVD